MFLPRNAQHAKDEPSSALQICFHPPPTELWQVEEHASRPVGENEAGVAALENPQVDAGQRILIGQYQ